MSATVRGHARGAALLRGGMRRGSKSRQARKRQRRAVGRHPILGVAGAVARGLANTNRWHTYYLTIKCVGDWPARCEGGFAHDRVSCEQQLREHERSDRRPGLK